MIAESKQGGFRVSSTNPTCVREVIGVTRRSTVGVRAFRFGADRRDKPNAQTRCAPRV